MNILKTLAAALIAVVLPAAALAQSNPGLTKGQVLTAGQWNALFAGKQDVLNFTPMNSAGGTFSGRVVTAPPGASTSGFNLAPGTTPGNPANGDLWVTSAGFFARVNGTTLTFPSAGIPGLTTDNTWTGANTFTDSIIGTSNGGGTDAAFLASAVFPGYTWRATGQAADQKIWDAFVNGTSLQFRAVNDANTFAVPWMTVTRGAGATVTNVVIPNLSSAASVKAYGASGSAQSTSGTIASGSAALTLSNAIDFKNGQGILVNHAGPASTVGAPAITAIVPQNATGSTTYTYFVASVDNQGGISSGVAASNSTGYANLGEYQSGINGIAMMSVTWSLGSGSPMCTAVWRAKDAGAYNLLGCFAGTNIIDTGVPTQSISWIPPVPTASKAGWLATTVVLGEGSTTLLLANTAGSSVSNEVVTHDDTLAVNAAVAALPEVYFPAGTYNLRGLSLPPSVHAVTGDGGGLSIINSKADVPFGGSPSGFGVLANPNGGSFYMSGMDIRAEAATATGGFYLFAGVGSLVTSSSFQGNVGLQCISCHQTIFSHNQVTNYWSMGINITADFNLKVLDNFVGAMGGQVGGVALQGPPDGSGNAYLFAAGVQLISGDTIEVSRNLVTMFGGVFGVSAQLTTHGTIQDNTIKYSGRECIAMGFNYGRVSGNTCYWDVTGNGNRSNYDYGMSAAYSNITNVDISNNTITNSAFSGIGLVGDGSAGPISSISVTGNVLTNTNQLPQHPCGIEFSGSNLSKVTAANNVHQSVNANMTYNVCEEDQGFGAPNNNTVSLPVGAAGLSGYVNLLGAGSKSFLLPSHTGQLATLAGVEALSNKTLVTPVINFGSGASSTIQAISTNTGFANALIVDNGGNASNANTFAAVAARLPALANGTLQLVVQGGASPSGLIVSGGNLTGGLTILAGAGPLVLTTPTITGSFTATGLVKNADLVNAATTVNGQTCTLGSTCTVTAAPGGTAGGDLTGSYPSPTLASIITAGGPIGSATVAPIITYDAKGRLTAVSSATITPSVGSVTGLGAGVATALAVAVGSAGAPVVNGGALGTPLSGVATNLTGTAAGLTAGNATLAASATKLATARAIGISGSTGLTATGVNFDGTAAINLALTGTLLPANGGTGNTGGPFTPYTPTVVCVTSTCTATGRYQTVGKIVFTQITVLVSGAGGNISTVSLPPSLPSATSGQWALEGRENTAGAFWYANIIANGSVGTAFTSTNSNGVSAGYSINLNGWYEAQ